MPCLGISFPFPDMICAMFCLTVCYRHLTGLIAVSAPGGEWVNVVLCLKHKMGSLGPSSCLACRMQLWAGGTSAHHKSWSCSVFSLERSAVPPSACVTCVFYGKLWTHKPLSGLTSQDCCSSVLFWGIGIALLFAIPHAGSCSRRR